MTLIRQTALLAALSLFVLTGCERRPADVPPAPTTSSPAPEVIPPESPASPASR